MSQRAAGCSDKSCNTPWKIFRWKIWLPAMHTQKKTRLSDTVNQPYLSVCVCVVVDGPLESSKNGVCSLTSRKYTVTHFQNGLFAKNAPGGTLPPSTGGCIRDKEPNLQELSRLVFLVTSRRSTISHFQNWLFAEKIPLSTHPKRHAAT